MLNTNKNFNFISGIESNLTSEIKQENYLSRLYYFLKQLKPSCKFYDIGKLLAWSLKTFNGDIRVARSFLAKKANCCLKTVSRFNKAFEKAGFVRIGRRYKCVNQYFFEFKIEFLRFFGLCYTSVPLLNFNYKKTNIYLDLYKHKCMENSQKGNSNTQNAQKRDNLKSNVSFSTPGLRPYVTPQVGTTPIKKEYSQEELKKRELEYQEFQRTKILTIGGLKIKLGGGPQVA